MNNMGAAGTHTNRATIDLGWSEPYRFSCGPAELSTRAEADGLIPPLVF